MLGEGLSFGLHPRPGAWSFSSTLSLGPALGQRGSRQSQAQEWPSFQGFLIAGDRESQGNPPSAPAPVIWPSMCQSSRPRWQAHDDTAIVHSPLLWCLDIPVIMAFQCQLACWVWPEPWDWQCGDNMFVSFAKFIGKGWGFWHTSVQQYYIKLVCESKLSVHI